MAYIDRMIDKQLAFGYDVGKVSLNDVFFIIFKKRKNYGTTRKISSGILHTVILYIITRKKNSLYQLQGFVTGEQEVCSLLPQLVDNRIIQETLTARLEADRYWTCSESSRGPTFPFFSFVRTLYPCLGPPNEF